MSKQEPSTGLSILTFMQLLDELALLYAEHYLVHMLTGCDSTSAFLGCGKVAILKLISSSPDLCAGHSAATGDYVHLD